MSGLSGGVYPGRFGPMFRGNFKSPEEMGEAFFAHMGVKTLAEARALPAEFVRDKTLDFPGHFGTVVDGQFQTDNSAKNLLAGKRLPVPLMVSRTSSEFMTSLRMEDPEELKKFANDTFGADAEAFLKLMGPDPAKWPEISKCSGIEIAARALARRSKELGIDAPIYYSVFDPEIPGWDNPGTFHSSDLWFWFETLAKCWRPFVGKHFDLARQMCNYMSNFIRSGDPNGCDADGTGMPYWQPLTDAAPAAMIWGDKAKSIMDEPSKLMKLLVNAWLAKN